MCVVCVCECFCMCVEVCLSARMSECACQCLFVCYHVREAPTAVAAATTHSSCNTYPQGPRNHSPSCRGPAARSRNQPGAQPSGRVRVLYAGWRRPESMNIASICIRIQHTQASLHARTHINTRAYMHVHHGTNTRESVHTVMHQARIRYATACTRVQECVLGRHTHAKLVVPCSH